MISHMSSPFNQWNHWLRWRVDFKPWTDALVKSTALFKTDPKVESLTAQARFRVVNEYFVNSEGTVTRHGSEVDLLALTGSTQAADGMRLGIARPSLFRLGYPTRQKRQRNSQEKATSEMVATLKALRDAPMVEEDYRGPVLFAPEASADIFVAIIGNNIIGVRPPGRRNGAYGGGCLSPRVTRAVSCPLLLV